MARPSDYTDSLAVEICGQLASGRPLTKICRSEEMPDVSTVYRWLQAHAQFRDRYARARDDQADTLADEIVEISDDGSNDTYVTEQGLQVNQDVIARSRLRVDARKWVAAKLKPKKYGELIKQEHSGPDGKEIKVGVVRFVRP